VAATVTGAVRAIDLGVTGLTLAVVAGADAAFPNGFVSGDNGIDGGPSNFLENGGTPVVTGDWYSGHAAFTAPTSVDITGAKDFGVLHFKVSQAGFNNIDGVRVGYYSGGNTANYAYWEFNLPAGGRDGEYHPFITIGTPTATGGAWDDTDVTGMIFMARADSTDVFAFAMFVDQLVFFQDVQFGDTGPVTPVSFADYYNLLQRSSSEDYRSLLVRTAGATVEFGFPFEVITADYDAPTVADGFAFKEADGLGYPVMAAGFFAATFTPPAAGSQVYSNMAGATNSPAYDLVIDGSAAGCTLDMSSCLFAGIRDVTITGANTTITASSFVDPVDVDISDADFTAIINNTTNPIVYSGALALGSILTTDSDIAVTVDVGDYTTSEFRFTANNNVTVDPTTDAGTYNLSSWVNTGFSTNFDIPSGNTFDTTIEISTDYTATRTNPTTGGGEITLAAPPVTVDFSAPNLIDDTRVRLYNVTQASEIENSILAGGSGYFRTLTRGIDYNNNDAKEVFRASATLTTGDFITNDAQVDWDNPNVLAIDGSTVTECTTDYIDVEVEVVDADDTTQKSRISAFLVDAITAADGIRNWVGLDGTPVIDYSTPTDATIDASVATVTVINTKPASKLSVEDDFVLRWSDGINRADAVIGSSIVWVAPDAVLLQNVGSGPLTPAQEAELTQASQAATVNSKIGTPGTTVSGDIADVSTDISNLNDFDPSTDTLEGAFTYDEVLRLQAAVQINNFNINGTDTQAAIRDIADTKDRLVIDTDAAGNRSVVSRDGT